MKSLRFVFTLIVASFFLFACTSEIKVKKVNDLIVDQEALTIKGNFGQAINGKSFQQDAMVTHKDYQYLGYYNANRHVCIARRQVQKNEWEIIEFDDYNFRSNDAHNTISIGICPNDGTIHMAFDHHGHPLHYRASKKDVANDPDNMEWSASLFGEVTSELEKGKSIRITYPRFWQTPDGGLQFCYRRGGSGNGDRMLVDYNANRGEWENTRQIDSGKGLFTDKLSESETRCSYPNGYTYDSTGKLHATWVWRESSQGANHDLI
ncbi:MAG: BNR-4 repeat-containing protein, partial [Draconibacterium sp.]|nr:BNR-4 repeat-containing protein [Draconibacterium sp.]